MATITVKTFIHAADDYCGGFRFVPFSCLMTEHGYLLVKEVDITTELPDDWNPTAQKVALIEKRLRDAAAEYHKTVTDLREQLARCQAITYEPAAA